MAVVVVVVDDDDGVGGSQSSGMDKLTKVEWQRHLDWLDVLMSRPDLRHSVKMMTD